MYRWQQHSIKLSAGLFTTTQIEARKLALAVVRSRSSIESYLTLPPTGCHRKHSCTHLTHFFRLHFFLILYFWIYFEILYFLIHIQSFNFLKSWGRLLCCFYSPGLMNYSSFNLVLLHAIMISKGSFTFFIVTGL